MKYVLIVLIVKELIVSPPWATSFSAEFDDLKACEAAAARIAKGVDRINAKAAPVCMPKSSDEQPAKATQ